MVNPNTKGKKKQHLSHMWGGGFARFLYIYIYIPIHLV